MRYLYIFILCWLCSSVVVAQQINYTEYFIGSDPGYGRGTRIPMSSGSSASADFHIPLASMEEGFHTLSLRTRDSNGKWSHTVRHPFVLTADGRLQHIIAFRYHLVGAEVSTSRIIRDVTVPAADVQEDFNVDLSALEQKGSYTLHVYAISRGGLESLVKTLIFNVQDELADQQITFPVISEKQYGEAPVQLNASASSGLPVSYSSSDNGIARVTDGKLQLVKPGTVTITASQSGTQTFAPAGEVKRTFTISKAPLRISTGTYTRKVGEVNPVFTPVYSGFVYGDDEAKLSVKPVITTTATSQSAAGTYPIQVSGAMSDYYEVAYTNGTLNVVSRDLTNQQITFPVISEKRYGDAPFQLNASASSGLAVSYSSSDNSIARVTDGKLQLVKPGTVTITASQSGNQTFAPAAEVSRTFTISKALLNIATGNYTRKVGEVNPVFTPVYSGFVYGDDETKLSVKPIITTTATSQSAAGTYPIQVSGAMSDYYEIAYISGVLNIEEDTVLETISISRALSPDGDGINDYLHIGGIESYHDNQLLIYAANGALVFDVKNYDNINHVFVGYSNKTKSNLPQGTYFYVLNVSKGETRQQITGYIVLKY